VKGAGQLQAVESNEKDKLPDEHTIEL
jgi:hypothetical protein